MHDALVEGDCCGQEKCHTWHFSRQRKAVKTNDLMGRAFGDRCQETGIFEGWDAVTNIGETRMFDLDGRKYPYMEEINEGILRQFKRYEPERKVLDVGCGRGQLGEAIQALGWEV